MYLQLEAAGGAKTPKFPRTGKEQLPLFLSFPGLTCVPCARVQADTFRSVVAMLVLTVS